MQIAGRDPQGEWAGGVRSTKSFKAIVFGRRDLPGAAPSGSWRGRLGVEPD